MTALNFPGSPTVGDTYNVGSRTWTWTTSYATTTSRTNLILNPNFEASLNNWSSAQTGSVRSTDFAYSGTNSYKVTVNTADSNVAYHSSSTFDVGSVTLSLYVYTPVGSTLAGRTISTSVEGGTATSSTVSNSAGTLVAGQWVRVSHVRNVTVAGTMIVVYRLSGTMGTASGQLLYFDAALGEQTASLLPYFDGTYEQLRTNLVTNSSFETNTTGWLAYNSTGTRDTAEYYSGLASYKLVGDGSQTYCSARIRIPVTAYAEYTMSFYAKATVGTPTARATLNWYTAGGTYISQNVGTATALTTSWGRRSVTATAPATATQVDVYIECPAGVSAGTTIFADAFLLESGGTLLSYFTGSTISSYTGYTLLSQSWSGTVNLSISTGTWGLDSSLNSLWTINAGALSTGVVGANELAAGAVTTAKIATNAITATTLAASPTNNYILTADSSTATGTKWATAQASGGLTTSTEGAIATMAIGA